MNEAPDNVQEMLHRAEIALIQGNFIRAMGLSRPMALKSMVIKTTDSIKTTYVAFTDGATQSDTLHAHQCSIRYLLLDPWASYRQTILFLPNQH